MTTLLISESGELHLTLQGAEENRILTTVRRWPHWSRVDIERDPANAENCLSVTLITEQAHESTVRDILKRSFDLTFPPTGGSRDLAPEILAPPKRRRRS